MKKIGFVLLGIILSISNLAGLETLSKHGYDSYYHFMQGLIYQRSGDIIQAQREFEKTIELDPNAISAYRELIMIYLTTAETVKIVPLVNKLNELVPDDTDTNFFLGGVYTLLKDTTNAVISYNKVLENDANNLNAIMLLGELYYDIDPEKSVQYWKKYIEVDPKSSVGYYQMGLAFIKLNRINDAKKILLEAIQKDTQNIAPRMALAQIYESEEDYLSAAAEYDKSSDLEENNLLLLLKAGSLYYLVKDFDKSEKVFKKTLKLYPEDISAHVWLSLLYEEKKDWLNAIEYLKYSVEKEPSLAGYVRLSYYYTQIQQNEKAISSLKKAIKLDPESLEPYFFIGLGYMDIKKYGKAEKYFIKTLKLEPEFKEAYFYLGVLYEQTDRFEKSIDQFRKLIELDPKNATALNYLGYSFADRNMNLDEAEEMIKRAIEIDPENPAYIDSLGWVYFRKGKFTESEKKLRKAIQKTEDPVIYDHLGDVMKKLGDSTEALRYYNKALELDEDNDEIKGKIKDLKNVK